LKSNPTISFRIGDPKINKKKKLYKKFLEEKKNRNTTKKINIKEISRKKNRTETATIIPKQISKQVPFPRALSDKFNCKKGCRLKDHRRCFLKQLKSSDLLKIEDHEEGNWIVERKQNQQKPLAVADPNTNTNANTSSFELDHTTYYILLGYLHLNPIAPNRSFLNDELTTLDEEILGMDFILREAFIKSKSAVLQPDKIPDFGIISSKLGTVLHNQDDPAWTTKLKALLSSPEGLPTNLLFFFFQCGWHCVLVRNIASMLSDDDEESSTRYYWLSRWGNENQAKKLHRAIERAVERTLSYVETILGPPLEEDEKTCSKWLLLLYGFNRSKRSK